MPTIVGILTFMSRINSCSAELSIKKSFITSGPGGSVSMVFACELNCDQEGQSAGRLTDALVGR